MGFQLQPREYLTIVRQLADHTDPTTYYVQAVIRNSRTDEVIDTVQLTDKGNGRFTKTWQVPPDVSGLGFYIDITTSVYTENTYTTKAGSYGDENDTYLVFDRIIKTGGGGGGADVDYKKLQKLFTEAASKIDVLTKKDLVQPNFEPIMAILDTILTAVRTIDMPEIPEQEKVDFTPVITAITSAQEALKDAIESKEVTPETDLSPVLAEIRKVQPRDIEEAVGKMVIFFNQLERDMPKIASSVSKVRDDLKEFIYALATSKNKGTEPVPQDPRVRALTGKA